jgi:FkbM family methyltransferase
VTTVGKEHPLLYQQLRFLASKEQFRDAPFKTAARLGFWKIHCLLSKGAIIELEDTCLRMSLPPDWHGHPKLLYALGWRFDPELPFLAENISKGAVVFDIGANIGTWSLILSEAVGANGRIFAYEPTLSTYDALVNNVALNSKSNVFAFRYALSNNDQQIRIYHDVDSSRNSLGQTRNHDLGDYEEVPARTLDSLAKELLIERLDFIKIDVEGAEPLVLKGASTTLNRFKPAILFEVNPKALAELNLQYDSSFRILADLSYRFYELRSDTLREISQCPLDGGNFWAVHSSDQRLLDSRDHPPLNRVGFRPDR